MSSESQDKLEISISSDTMLRFAEAARRKQLSPEAYLAYVVERALPDVDTARLDGHVDAVFGEHGELMRRLSNVERSPLSRGEAPTHLSIPMHLAAPLESRAKAMEMDIKTYVLFLVQVAAYGLDREFVDAARFMFKRHGEALRKLADS